MAQDIFDQVAPAKPASPDIFDEVAQPTGRALPKGVDYSSATGEPGTSPSVQQLTSEALAQNPKSAQIPAPASPAVPVPQGLKPSIEPAASAPSPSVPFTTNPRTGQRTPITSGVVPPSVAAALSASTAPIRSGARAARNYIASEAASLDPNSLIDVQVPSIQHGGKPQTLPGSAIATGYKNALAPAAEKSAEFLEGTYQPENLGVLAAPGLLPAGSAAAKLAHAATVAYFLPSMTKGAIEQGVGAVQSAQQGDVPGAVRQGVGSAIDALFAAGIASGAVKGVAAEAKGVGTRAYETSRESFIKSLTDYAVKKMGGNPEDIADAGPARQAAERYAAENGIPGPHPGEGLRDIPQNLKTASQFKSAAERVRGTGLPSIPTSPDATSEPAAPPVAEPPSAIQADAARQSAENTASMATKDAAEAKASEIARGVPQPPPPVAPQPEPPPMVNDQNAQAVAHVISQLPEEAQPAAIMEAVQTAAASILHHQGAVVDGEVHVASTPEQAQKIAAKIINAQIEQADKLAESPSDASPEKTKETPVEPAQASEVATGAQGSQAEAVVSKPDIFDKVESVPRGTITENSEISKGSRVTLSDGREGEVTYSHPKMSILRVKTDDGENVTTSKGKVKPASAGELPPSVRKTEEVAEKVSSETQPAARAARGSKPKPPSSLEIAREAYKPGAVVQGYAGTHDKVVGFDEGSQYPGGWQVRVQDSDAQGNVKPGERIRAHHTPPERLDEIAARKRLQAAAEPSTPSPSGVQPKQEISPSSAGKEADKIAQANTIARESGSTQEDGTFGPAKTSAQPEKPAAVTLADELFRRISADEMPSDNNALRRVVSEFDGKPAENARLKEAQEDLEVAIVRRARAIVESGKELRTTFDDLVELYDSQPNLNIRTSTSVENQAYSTPAPLAFVADKLAGVDAKSKVYEPTGGNGMLLIAAEPKNVTTVELNDKRVEGLRSQGFKVIQGDATKAEMPRKSVDSVVTNPPFGTVKENGLTVKVSVDGYKIGKIDHLIAARALDAMKDDGRAVLILGADKVTGGISTDDRIFFNWLYSHYNVLGNFEVSGSLYGRQGANWPVRVITVGGRMESANVSPTAGVIERVGDWDGVYEQLTKGLETVERLAGKRGADSSIQRTAGEDQPQDLRATPARPAGAVDRVQPAAGQEHPEPISAAPSRPVPDRTPLSGEKLAGRDHAIGSDAIVPEPGRLEQPRPIPEPSGKRTAQPRSDHGSSLASEENQYQARYAPASAKKDSDVLIPTNMRQPLEHAMRALEDAVGDIDQFAADQLGYKSVDDMHDVFMGLQVDAIAAAIHQMQNGKAVVIADQTGIGKGREAAGVIRWAIKNGDIPVFVTAKPSLFSDMYGDLSDIGSDDVRPFIVNLDESITRADGKKVFANSISSHRAMLKKIAAGDGLPQDRNAVFLTYSQINQPNTQQQLLRALASRSIFVLDESHSAGGDSNTGEYLRSLLATAKGVTYLSATYAKRPDNMPLYFKTDMGEAIADSGSLISAMKEGGLPLQTVVSNNLVKAGQMFRRERSFKGIDIATKVDTARRKEHTKLADATTEALRAIVDADREFHDGYVAKAQKDARREGKAVSGGGNKASTSVQHGEFTAVVHNFVRQMLLGIKADSAADEAIEAMKRGHKPIIAVDNTMGSFLGSYVGDNHIQQGESLESFDYRTVLSRALDRTRYLQITDPQGNKSKRYVPLSELDGETLKAYQDAQAVIDKLQIDLPVSPIDWIRNRIEQAGHSVAEITGRSLSVDYSEPHDPKLAHVSTQEQKDKVETIRRFNDGRLDSLILNVAGSTGLSAHASEKFSDQRPRHMIVAQPAQDINVFMQMLGRINRTGQMELPRYTILNADLPAEKRPSALLSKKMKSLNANTSSNTESATSIRVPDMLNKYGDQIVGNYLNDNAELESMLGLDGLGENGEPVEDIARRATGKLAILPVAIQDAFYRDVEQQYNDYIDYLDATNQNELEPKTFDYDAKETASKVMLEGANPSTPFGQDAIYGEYSIKSQAKPITPDEVKEEISKGLDGKTQQQRTDALIATLDKQLDDYRRTLDAESPMVAHSEQVAQTARSFILNHQIGSTLRIEINGDTFSAAVVNLRSTHKAHGNPYAMSKISVQLATTGPMRFVSVPATQLNAIEVAPLYEQPESLFRVARTDLRTQAKIVTGNLLAAFGELKGTRGTIINFSKADGSTEQGILLPKKFDIGQNTRGDLIMRSAEHIIKFLKTSSNPMVERMGIASRDGDVRVVNDRDRLVIVTPKSKARGGKYFLDHGITDLTGDFVSQGSNMRATIPVSKERAVIDHLMKKTALYASPSMAEEARAMEPKKGESPARGKRTRSQSGMAMREAVGGFPGTEKAAEAVGAAWKSDVQPVVEKLGQGLGDTARLVTESFYPRIEETSLLGRTLGIGVSRNAMDAFMKMKGQRDRAMFNLEAVGAAVKKFFDRLPEQQRIDFLDRYKTGQPQATPELDELAKYYSRMDEAMYQAIAKYRPSLNHLENHFRLFWKVIPGSGEAQKGGMNRYFSKRPFQGTRGMLKKHTLATASEGLEKGGKLVSTNPQTLFELGQMDSLKYVTAQKMWERLQDLGLRKFAKKGERPQDGFEDLDDNIAKVYFPVEITYPSGATVEKPLESGRWTVEHNAHRILKNFLSRDLIREHALGRGLMWAKNMTTAVELSLSPFHAVFETIEAAGSQFGLGAMKIVNQGIRQGDVKALAAGLADVVSSPSAPITQALLGGDLIRFAKARATGGTPQLTVPKNALTRKLTSLRDMYSDRRLRRFVKKYPEAADLLADLFDGGAQLDMHRDYEVQSLQTVMESWTSGNPLGAFIRVFPATAHLVMKPLFQVYIPRLKVGYFLKQYSQQLQERADDLAEGRITRAELARKVWQSVENRFGEMNFDNMMWNRTLKSALQLAFRSVTWKAGNVGLFAGGAMGQAKDLMEWVHALPEYAPETPGGETPPPRAKSFGEKAVPHLDMNMAWIVGVAFTTAMLATVWSKLETDRYPWEWAADGAEDKWDEIQKLYTEFTHPRTGEEDYRGKPVRISLPTYWRDLEHGASSPGHYVVGSFSSTLGKTLDVLQNEDFGGNYVYNPTDDRTKKMMQVLNYVAPSPFSLRQYRQASGAGESRSAGLAAFGFTRAGRDLDLTRAEKRMEDLIKLKQPRHTPEDLQQYRENRQRILDDDLTPHERVKALHEAAEPWLVKQFRKLDYIEARDVYENYANEDEKDALRPVLNKKRTNLLRRNPDKVHSAEQEQ